jgi:hypothetical protein
MVMLTGQVSDLTPQNDTVSFSGVVSGSVAPDFLGSFTTTLQASSLGTITAQASNAAGVTSAPVQVTLSSATPSVTLSVSWGAGNQVVVSGQVTDPDPQDSTVTIAGPVSATLTPDAQGAFSATVAASYLGNITTQAVDVWGQASSTATMDLTTAAPGVTLAISYGAGAQVTLTGHVTSQDPQDSKVSFSGPVTGWVQPNASGNFSYTAQASGIGTVQAIATDVWGQSSAAATVAVTDTAPIITDFDGTQGTNNNWTFQGDITASSLTGLTFALAGFAQLQGVSVDVSPTGDFCFSVQLDANANGTVTVTATDAFGLTSNTASALVRQS